MLTVVGLGNPGARYKKTRHNVGFMLLDGILAGDLLDMADFSMNGGSFVRKIIKSKVGFKKASRHFMSIEGTYQDKQFCMVKPTTFMNESGKAVISLLTKGIIKDVSELIVVFDDVDTDIGKIRFRAKGSAGGHKGLKSIIQHLGTTEFSRLRIGVGPRPTGDEMVEYVLGSFHPDEFENIHKSLNKSAQIVGSWISGGLEETQNTISKM